MRMLLIKTGIKTMGYYGMGNKNISWLMTTPSGNCNFKSALERATDEEIQATISNLDGKSGVKTKLKALEAELKRRNKRK